eukprot:179352-Ditylum_brightwellii.AAC.1
MFSSHEVSMALPVHFTESYSSGVHINILVWYDESTPIKSNIEFTYFFAFWINNAGHISLNKCNSFSLIDMNLTTLNGTVP